MEKESTPRWAGAAFLELRQVWRISASLKTGALDWRFGGLAVCPLTLYESQAQTTTPNRLGVV